MKKLSRFATLIAAALLAISGIFFAATTASAHAELVSSDPAAGAVIGSAPDAVNLTFGEELMTVAGNTANQVQVTNSAKDRVDTGKVKLDGANISIGLKPDLALDSYTVSYRVVSADGHPIEGSYQFVVSEAAQSEVTPIAVDDTDTGGETNEEPLVISPAPQATNPLLSPWMLAIGGVVVVAVAVSVIIYRRRRE